MEGNRLFCPAECYTSEISCLSDIATEKENLSFVLDNCCDHNDVCSFLEHVSLTKL